MKKSNLITGFADLIIGIVLLLFALSIQSKLEGILFGFGGGFIGSGLMLICRYFYWSSEKHKKQYQEKIDNEKIERNDELKEKLRNLSGRYAYISGLIVISASMIIFSILGSLEIISNSRLIILYLGGYLVFQILVGIVIFNRMLKKME